MANQEQHLGLITQHVQSWNKWRAKNPTVEIDLSFADLEGVNLSHAYLSEANLSGVDLSHAYLSEANLYHANLAEAGLFEANLSHANLYHANLYGANLIQANLQGAFLRDASLMSANLQGADLAGANLRGAELTGTNFEGADLAGANFSDAELGSTVFGDVDLSTVKGLESVDHIGPSTIGIDTIINSQGKIPEIFLKEAGVPDSIIEAIPSLVGSLKPIDYYSCFISYSSKDQDFAQRLYADLLAEGVRCWLDKEDLKIGEKFRPRIDEAIRRHDKLLLVLSDHSTRSTWVVTEVETAFEKERRYKKLVLFPIRLDEAVMRTRKAWASDIRRQRHIGDFTCWKDHDIYQKSFARLLSDLKSEA